jgi:T-complex protein 1 subunit eta
MELSRYLREYSRTVAGKSQMLIAAYAKALEAIPRQLCENAGFDSTNILNLLRNKHHNGILFCLTWLYFAHFPPGGLWYGIDITTEGIADNYQRFVWEPAVMKINVLKAAAEAACVVLTVDETVKNPKCQDDVSQQAARKGRAGGVPR